MIVAMRFILISISCLIFWNGLPGNTVYAQTPYKVRLEASDAVINGTVAEVVPDERLSAGKGITLKAATEAATGGERTEPDLVFEVEVPTAGRYSMRTYAVTDEEGAALMKKAKTKFESMFMRIQIGDQRPTKRVVYVPWDRPLQHTGKFELTGGKQKLKIWLPRGVRLGYAELSTYTPPAVPEAARDYRPPVTPPAHPRLWVNAASLPAVRARLEADENKAAWAMVKAEAQKPFAFAVNPAEEVSYNPGLERAVEYKAFYYLMTGEKKTGREAVKLVTDYLPHVEFGNILDITREIGRAIYAGSLVYDWCYDLLSAGERELLYRHLMRLADDMEIGWPPFLQSVVNGHGNEAQVCRDLLSMSIAIYDEDPLPYQYCSYAILETLVPLRKFEYQSPRHNQGVHYGPYRFQWDMHAAWLFYRMTGQPVFDDNIKDVSKFWLYMRTPDGGILRDGDGFGAGMDRKPYYWNAPQTMLLCYAYANDPIVKGEFVRQGGLPGNPVLFLLLNDPALKTEPGLESLPLTAGFGPVLGSMIARTGWDISETSDDVLAEIKGGGYHFGNHQHADAGALQLYYRGFQIADLGVYKFYGTPYDLNFNKRSVAHSMMLVVDPSEKFLATESNDGGSRFIQRHPRSVAEVLGDSTFHYGKVLAESFGPSAVKPAFSYFSADLSTAYSQKISVFNRSFCFLNMDRKDIPAIIILSDDITATDPAFRKYWQVNTLNQPEALGNGLVLSNSLGGRTGKTHLNMLVPDITERVQEIRSGADANSSFAFTYEAPPVDVPEIKGHRILISPKQAHNRDRFLTVFQVADGNAQPLDVNHTQTAVSDVLFVGDRLVSMNRHETLIDQPFELDIPKGKDVKVALTGMMQGKWKVTDGKGAIVAETSVEAGKHTLFFAAAKGKYRVTPLK